MGTIRIDKSTFAVADAILAMLTRDWGFGSWDDETVEEISVRAWSNCREQGYMLVAYEAERALQICFGEHRNTDMPTIWHREGKEKEFPDGEWKNATPRDESDAAEWIRDRLTQFYETLYEAREKKGAA